jgi:hypothetical protein
MPASVLDWIVLKIAQRCSDEVIRRLAERIAEHCRQ